MEPVALLKDKKVNKDVVEFVEEGTDVMKG